SVHGCHPQLLRAVMEINRDQRLHAVRLVREALGELRGAAGGLLGLAFKPGTDAMRDAPAGEVAGLLGHGGARGRGYDPAAGAQAARLLRGVELRADPYDLAEGADALILVTEWNEFKQLDLGRLRRGMRRPVLIDGRNLYDPAAMAAAGFDYRSIG